MNILVRDGNAETLDKYSQDVELLLLETRSENRALLRPRLVAAPPANSAQRKLAMRLSRDPDVDEREDLVDRESIASVHGANNLVQAFRRSLGTQIIAKWESAQTSIQRRRHLPHGAVPKTQTNDVTVDRGG